MKLQLSLITSVLLSLFFMIFLTTCKVDVISDETLNNPNLGNKNDDEICSATIMGKILDASNLLPIEAADIFSTNLNVNTTSGTDGTYQIEIPFPNGVPAGNVKMEVQKSEYVNSIIEIDLNDYYFDCTLSDVIIDLDFVLTPISESPMPLPSGNQSSTVAETQVTTVEVEYNPNLDYSPDQNFAINRGFQISVTSNNPLTITPISNDQYLGYFDAANVGGVLIYENMIQRFHFDSEEALMVTNPSENAFVAVEMDLNEFEIELNDNLKYYVLNETTNRWEEEPSTTSYNAQENTVTISFETFKFGMITNASKTFSILNDEINAATPIASEELYNCDCSDPRPITFSTVDDNNQALEQLDQELIVEGTRGLGSLLHVIQNFKILANISASTSLENLNFLGEGDNQVPGFVSLRVFDSISVSEDVVLDKCKTITKRVQPYFRRIQGRYDGNLFDYKSFAAIRLPESAPSDCPIRIPGEDTNTDCHQGCPQ